MSDISSAITAAAQSVQDVVKLAQQKLDSSGITQWVSSGEVIDVSNAINGLGSRAEKDAAWEQIDRPTFIDEMYGSGAGGTVSADDRATIFHNIALQADGETAAAFAQDLAASGDSVEGRERLQEFADIYAEHARPQDKVDFIEALSPAMSVADRTDVRFLDSTVTSSGDIEAKAAATVLSTLDGAYAQEAVANLDSAELIAMTDATAEVFRAAPGDGGEGTARDAHDASRFGAFANTIAQYGTASQKAVVFDAAGDTLAAMQDKGAWHNNGVDVAAPQIAAGLDRILQSDTNGVMSALTRGPGSTDGRALSAYAEQAVAAGNTDKLAAIQAVLLNGDGSGTQTSADRFNASIGPADSRQFINAENLGYFSGAVQNGVSSVHADAEARAAVAGDMVKTTSAILGGAVSLGSAGWAAPAGFAIGVAGEGAGRGLTAVLSGPRDTIDEVLVDAALPRDPQTGMDISSSASFSAFEDRMQFVITAATRNGG